MTSTKELTDRVAGLDPVREDQLRDVSAGPTSMAVLASITSERAAAPVDLGPAGKPGRRGPSRRFRVGIAVAAAAALAVMVTAVSWLAPSPAVAAVTVNRVGGFYVVDVVHPDRDSAELSSALRATGLDITLRTEPVSPSLVGTIVTASQVAPGIVTEQSGHCLTGVGGCPIGLRIPVGYPGSADITLGRAARPGEDYASAASSLAPGEALHCVPLVGTRVGDGVAALQRRGLRVQFNPPGDANLLDAPAATPPVTWFVTDVIPRAAGAVVVLASPIPPPPLATQHHEADYLAGC